MSFLRKFLGIFIALLIGAGTLFLLLRFYSSYEAKKHHKDLRREFLVNGKDDVFPEWNEIAEFRAVSKIRYVGEEDGKTVFDVIYETDKKAFRKEDMPSGPFKEHLLLGGCSFIFGIAIQKNETLSTYLRKELPHTNVVNIGHGGGGLHTQLRLFDLIDLKKDYASEENGTYIYFFYSDHLQRWKGNSSYLVWAQEGDVHYEWKNGKLEHSLIKDFTGYKDFQQARKAGIENAFIKGKSLKETLTQEDLHGYAKGIKVLKEKYLKRYPKGRFVLALYPFMPDPAIFIRFKQMLNKEKIPFIDYVDSYQKFAKQSGRSDSDFIVPLDGHPNKIFNEYYAGELIQSIGLQR